jgi:hypothetical protein
MGGPWSSRSIRNIMRAPKEYPMIDFSKLG